MHPECSAGRHRGTGAYCRVVHAFGTTSQIKTAHPPYCQLPGRPALSEARPGPQLSSQLAALANHRRCKVISLRLPLASSRRPSCHSSRNVDSEPREIEPPQRQAARTRPALGNYVPLWQLRRPGRGENCRSLFSLADLIGSLPRSSFGSDLSVLPSVHSDGTAMLLCSSGQLHQSVQSHLLLTTWHCTRQGRPPRPSSKVLSLRREARPSARQSPNPADVTIGAPPLAHPTSRGQIYPNGTTIQTVGVGWPWPGWLQRKLHSNCKM